MKGCTIVTVANQKGGVAKTTTCLELAYGLKRRGYHVAVCDMEPQANLTKAINRDGVKFDRGYVSDLLKSDTPVFAPNADAYQGPVYRVNEGINIIPSPPRKYLASVENEMLSMFSRESRLKDPLNILAERNHYDFIIIDTPPALGTLTFNALTAARRIIVPCQPEDFAVEGIMQLNETVRALKSKCNPELEYSGVLLTRVQDRANIHKAYSNQAKEISSALNIRLFEAVIPQAPAIPESQSRKISLNDNVGLVAPSKRSKSNKQAALMYDKFVEEFLEAINNGN